MKNFLSKSLSTILVIFLSTNLVIASGIPVVDAAATAQRQTNFLMDWMQTMKDYGEKVKVWSEEHAHRVQEINKWAEEKVQWANDLYTKTGIRDVVNFGKEMKDVYEQAYRLGNTVYREVSNFSLDNFDERAWELYRQYGGTDNCSKINDLTNQNICKKSVTAPFKEFQVVNRQFERLKKELEDINTLEAYVSRNKGKNEDLKTSIDTQNQIAILRARQENNWRQYEREMNDLKNEKERMEQARITYMKNTATQDTSRVLTTLDY